ncbi:hypothetical protein C8R44DRAFT_759990 [Mycena epipterygia]|nr:hypothetical protein C8R44DRAFT_759990 [Mycena epipterygia]
MAKFTLTPTYISGLLDPVRTGDWSAFVGAIDPNVHWTIGSETKDNERMTGVYNLASWMEEVSGPLGKRLQARPKFTVDAFDVIGNKAILECRGEGTQANGKPYNNLYAWFLIFSEETGKIVTIREYLDTALVHEVVKTNPL